MEISANSPDILKRRFVVRCGTTGREIKILVSKFPPFIQSNIAGSIDAGCHDYTYATAKRKQCVVCEVRDEASPHTVSVILEY